MTAKQFKREKVKGIKTKKAKQTDNKTKLHRNKESKTIETKK